MSELDNLLSESFMLTIKENLGQKTFQKIEKRIFEKHGMNLSQSLKDFTKIDSVLREFFGNGAEGLEKQYIRNVITLEKTTEERQWLVLESKSLSKSVLEAFTDPDKNNILNSVLEESRITSDILEICNIPQTSGYRKVNSLIETGLLVSDGFVTIHDGKEVTKYRSMFENVKIDVEKNNVTVKVKIPTKFLERSHVIQLVQT